MPDLIPPQSNRLGTRWRTTFFAGPDHELAAAFRAEITWDNLHRTRLLNGLAFALSLLLIAIPDLLLWRAGGWENSPSLREWFLLHATLLGTSAMTALLLSCRRRAGPAEIQPFDNTVLQLISSAYLLVLLVNTVVQQDIASEITTVLLGIGVYASCFYSTPRESLLVIGGFSTALILVLPWVQPRPSIVINHIVVTAVFALIFWLVSRLIYSLRARDFNQLQTIATQARSLERANAGLRNANALKSELVGIAAHDLRDPLNAISGLAQELNHELPADSPARELVDGIGQSARRISQLVDNLLTNAENEVRGLILRRQPTDVGALLTDVIADYRWLASTKQLSVHTDLPIGPPVTANLDAQKFRQLLENLLSNAIKYSPPHKIIRIVLRTSTPTTTAAPGIRLEVHDEGAGLIGDDRQHLFGKFERLSSRPTHGESTSGLGLAIVKAIVDAHGGRVWAESPGRDRGTTFVVEIP